MRAFLSLSAAVVLALPGVGQAGTPPAPLARTGPWNVNYDDNSCHLIGHFGADKAAVTSIFTRFEPGDSFEWQLMGKAFLFEQPFAPVKISFGAAHKAGSYRAAFGSEGAQNMVLVDGVRLDNWQFTGGIAGRARLTLGQLVERIQPPSPVSEAIEAAATSASVEIPGRRPVTLALGRMDKASHQRAVDRLARTLDEI